MKVRVISAAVVIAGLVPFVYFGGTLYAFLIGVLAVLALREVMMLNKAHKDIPLVPSILTIISCLLLVYTNFNGDSTTYGITYARLIFVFLSLLLSTIFYSEKKFTTRDAFYLIGFSILIGLAFNSFILVRDRGVHYFLYLALVPVITDTFALLTGMRFGKHKLSPAISPKKTWEGFAGGLIVGTIIPVIYHTIFISPLSWQLVIGTMILSIVGQAGDLVFSKIKRENDIKDFSNLMPGHGGVLDRLDSAIFIFTTYILLTAILF